MFELVLVMSTSLTMNGRLAGSGPRVVPAGKGSARRRSVGGRGSDTAVTAVLQPHRQRRLGLPDRVLVRHDAERGPDGILGHDRADDRGPVAVVLLVVLGRQRAVDLGAGALERHVALHPVRDDPAGARLDGPPEPSVVGAVGGPDEDLLAEPGEPDGDRRAQGPVGPVRRDPELLAVE